ncbi:MAG: hypothetical protein HOP11_08260 [Saprospiraceae bacterium]|nr:hypothetical protein [Saprospiraceae bacterium]
MFLIYTNHLLAKEFFVSVSGIPTNSGTVQSPWNLQYALDHPSVVRPGDTISMLEGHYYGKEAIGDYRGAGFISKIKGTKDNPIIVRAFPGHRVILDGGNRQHPTDRTGGLDSHVIGIFGDYTWYIGFEITDSSDFSRSGYNTGQTWRVRSMFSTGTGLKFINLLVYDTGNGLGPFSGCVDCESYGNIVFYNGWSNLGIRGHGEGFYGQNSEPVKKLIDNIVFKNFDSGIILYGSGQATINNFHLEGNVVFQNGVINDDPNGWGFLFGKNTTTTGTGNNFLIKENYHYNRFDYNRSNNIDLAYQSGLSNVIFRDNYSVGFNAVKYNIPVVGLSAIGNTFVGNVNQVAANQISRDSNSIFSSSNPPKNNIISIRPNLYEKERAHIVVYNWENKLSEKIDLLDLNLVDNREYEFLDVQNIFGSAIVRFKYSSSQSEILLPLTLNEVTKVAGDSVPRPAVHTESLFNVFLLRRVELNTSLKVESLSSYQIYQINDKELRITSNDDEEYSISMIDLFGKEIISTNRINRELLLKLPESGAGIFFINIRKKGFNKTHKLSVLNAF